MIGGVLLSVPGPCLGWYLGTVYGASSVPWGHWRPAISLLLPWRCRSDDVVVLNVEVLLARCRSTCTLSVPKTAAMHEGPLQICQVFCSVVERPLVV